MTNKIDIVSVLKKDNINYTYLLHDLSNKTKERRITHHILRDTSNVHLINI